MANIKITIKNLSQIKRAFGQAPQLMTKELNIAIRKTVLTIEGKSKQNTPVDTGRLRSSHTTLFNNLKGSVYTNTNYDTFVHDGTKFMKARPYMEQAVDQTEGDRDRFFTQAVDNVLAQIGRQV